MTKSKKITSFFDHFPPSVAEYCFQLWQDHPFDFIVSKTRDSKLGDYRFSPQKGHQITVNHNLNPYSFLVTYLHEVAHLLTYQTYKNKVLPHGNEWKKAFHDVLNFDGVILTKLDGDTRGGAAISIKSVVTKPIKFIGTGEKMEALDVFYPERMADRILGMGDVVSLVERAQDQFDEEEARKIQKKIAKNTFGFDDFLTQIQQIKKMGNLKDLMGMIPGAGKALKGLDIDDDAFKHIEAIIHSMTPLERSQPTRLDASRKKRIAKGSGRTIQDVNQLLKQFDQMSKMMKMMQGGGGKKMMQMMGGLGGMR